MIRYVKGSIFDGDEDILVHGCNCFCRMGAGIAKEIRRMFPEAYEADRRTASGDTSKLGNFTFARVDCNGDEKYIVNLYTQFIYGNPSSRGGQVFLDYKWMEDGFRHVNEYGTFKGKTIAMPLIGCGLAGGDWNVVSGIIDGVFGDREIVVYHLDDFKPKTEHNWWK